MATDHRCPDYDSCITCARAEGAEDAVERIVAWLRAATAATRAIEAERGVPNLASPILQETADRIERGEWRVEKGGG